MKKIIFFFKNWLFNVRKKQAIKQAQQLANEQRRKFLVINFKGKPTVVSMKQIKFWISTKQVNKCITDDRIEIDVNALLRLSKRILKNEYHEQNEIHFKVKGSLYKYNSQGRIPG